MNPFGSEKPRSALNYGLNVIKAGLRSENPLGHAKDATNEIFVCQRNKKGTFEFVWYRHVAKQQWTRHPSVNVISNVEGRVWRALS
jgi:hypothetical protein